MSENIHKSHNVSKLMYHFVFPTKYRRVVVTDEVDQAIKEICIEISKRYDLYFLEIGTDKDHVHFLIQAVPSYSPTQIVKIVKSITAKEIFARCPEVKKKLWAATILEIYGIKRANLIGSFALQYLSMITESTSARKTVAGTTTTANTIVLIRELVNHSSFHISMKFFRPTNSQFPKPFV